MPVLGQVKVKPIPREKPRQSQDYFRLAKNANVIEEPMQSKTHGQERAPRRIWINAIEEPVQAETHGPE